MSTLVEAQQLTLYRDQQAVLENVSLTVGERDFITIIGPNGAGKSTLLKCLLGIYQPDKGVVTRKKNLQIGYVPQSVTADYSMPITAQRFLSLNKKCTPDFMRDISAKTNIENVIEKPLHALSSGQLQRVLLARALLDEPELLVLDEPAQNLDITGQLDFYQLLEQIYKERLLSILIVSHDLHLVMSRTKQVVCLFHHICCSGEPQR